MSIELQHVLEFGTLAISPFIFARAAQKGHDALMYLAAATFVSLAFWLGSGSQEVSFGSHLVSVGGLPLYVALGWANLCYGSFRVTEHSTLPIWAKVSTDTLLLLSAQAVIEPIAMRLGAWSWATARNQGLYFGVPVTGLLAGSVLVASYSLCFHLESRLNASQPVRVVLSIGSVVVALALTYAWSAFLLNVLSPALVSVTLVSVALLSFTLLFVLQHGSARRNSEPGLSAGIYILLCDGVALLGAVQTGLLDAQPIYGLVVALALLVHLRAYRLAALRKI
jgi:hypothetical protein